jgi:plastocyanin domain-containing protein
MNKTVSLIITAAMIISLGIFVFGGSKKSIQKENGTISNIETKNGIQYITINAKDGYSPQSTNAKAGIPTKLIIKTNDTYDCAASIVINSINYQKVLPQTGEEIVDLGTPKSGELTQGVCGMGMYNFVINFY